VPLAFTERQLEAIEHERGPMEVMAGPGTGKTALLVERQARLIEKRLAWKYDILSLTFTRRDAAEMRERLQLRLGEDVDQLPIYTAHAYARRILKSEHAHPDDKPFRLYDPAAAFRVLRRAMSEVNLAEHVWPPRFVAGVIADAKEQGLGPEEFLTVPDSASQRAISRVYERYQALLAEAGAYDFSDLILSTARLLETGPELLAQIHEQHPFIQVDEWQDVSVGQYHLLRLLTGPQANLFVVGSESQAIYEWRRANYRRLSHDFYQDFPQARRVVLEDNFRSREPILKASRALFNGRYRDVNLIAHRGSGEPVQDVRLPTDDEEAAFVVSEARRLHDLGTPWKEMAVLYRANSQSTLLQQEFIRQQVPYNVIGQQRLYHRREIRDLLAYLSLASDGDESCLSQILNSPPRGLGPVSVRLLKGNSPSITWEHLTQALAYGEEMKLRPQAVEAINQLYDLLTDLAEKREQMTPADLIDYALEKTGYRAWLAEDLEGEVRLASLRTLQREAAEYASLSDFLSAMSEKIAADSQTFDEAGVALSTIHSAKGLQFDAVFIVGMEEGLLPHVKASGGSDEGERRLAYVAMTRARDRLYLVSAGLRERDGRRVDKRPSRYLTDLPRDVVTRRRLTITP
jgi:DNA helicase-2/ATP-dependent DNA helicase PcrA